MWIVDGDIVKHVPCGVITRWAQGTVVIYILKHISRVQVLVRWKSKLHLGTFWVLEASGKRWRTQTFMLRVRVVAAIGSLRSVLPFPSLRRSQGRALLRMLRKSTTNVQRKYDLAQLEVNIVWGAIVHAHLAVNAFCVRCLLPDRNEQCQVERALDCPMTWHPRCLFAMV